MNIFSVHPTNSDLLEKFYGDAMNELNNFFHTGWVRNKPKIMLVESRAEINLLKGEKTDSWVVGWADGHTVFMLSLEDYEKESSHKYSDNEYFSLLKHGLCHLFLRIVSNYSRFPEWFEEGVCIYLSGQNEFKNRPEIFCNFLDSKSKGFKVIYRESGFVVEFLINKFGKEKLIKLIKEGNNQNFPEKFKDIYGSYPTYDFFNRKAF